jgi:hypothetical protein
VTRWENTVIVVRDTCDPQPTLDQMGADGWELVSHTAHRVSAVTGQRWSYTFTFKRPKGEQ